jgi:3-keto-disaccharide hydrolase
MNTPFPSCSSCPSCSSPSVPIRYIRVIRVLSALLIGVMLGPQSGAEETKSALEADPKGWKEITPNAKLEGWTRLPIPAGGKLGREQWRLDPETKNLVCDGDGGHDWLRYDRELGDFVYHVEWRYVPVEGKSGYNSGVYARNSADAKIWHQAQVGSKSGGFIFGDTMVGGELKRINLSKDLKEQRVRPAGEWNTYEITCKGKTMTLWVNGAVTNEWAGCEVPKGHVGLEGEGWKIEFRNIKIKER